MRVHHHPGNGGSCVRSSAIGTDGGRSAALRIRQHLRARRTGLLVVALSLVTALLSSCGEEEFLEEEIKEWDSKKFWDAKERMRKVF